MDFRLDQYTSLLLSIFFSGEWIHFSRELILSKWFWFPSEKRVYSKRKEFASLESKFFPFKAETFSEGTWCAGKQTGIAKVVSLVKHGLKSTRCFHPP